MKTTIPFIFILLFTSTINAQFFDKLAKKAEKAVERTVERKVEEKAERTTDEKMDKVLNKKSKTGSQWFPVYCSCHK